MFFFILFFSCSLLFGEKKSMDVSRQTFPVTFLFSTGRIAGYRRPFILNLWLQIINKKARETHFNSNPIDQKKFIKLPTFFNLMASDWSKV